MTEKLEAKRDGWFVRSAAAVGDLSNPFYDEERQRDVWNEASAVGFQVMLWSGLIAANLMVWLGGATGAPYAVGVFALLGIGSSVALGYSRRLGVDAESLQRLWRWPMVPFVALMVLFFLGIARASFDSDVPASVYVGFATGGLVVLAWSIVSIVRRRRQSRGQASSGA